MKRIFIALCCGAILMACNKPKEEAAAPAAPPPEPPQAEIGDPKYADMGRQSLANLSSGDMDTWLSQFADNAKYYWSGGDSLIGKEAIGKYWKDRRSSVIDKLSFTNDIWLILKVNRPQKGPDRVGNWIMGWYQVSVTYKNGQSVNQWVHTDMHLDAADKVDQLVHYIDNAPIKAALAKKK